MEIGTEISHKIRSAIKAKLVELGAYVDEELPDYIMVMVANKKSLKQMSDDLDLFLAAKTNVFTSWLHELLKKLQSIGGETRQDVKAIKSKKYKKHDDKFVDDEEKQTELLNRENGGVTEDKTYEILIESTEIENEPGEIVDKEQSADETSELQLEEITDPTTLPLPFELSDPPVETLGPTTYNILPSVTSDPPSVEEATVDDEIEPELLVRADTDEFSEELQIEEIKHSSKSVKPTAKSAPVNVRSDTTRAVVTKSSVIPIREIIDNRHENRSSIMSRLGFRTDSRPRAVASPIKQMPSSTRHVSVNRKRRGPTSVVGNVINTIEEKEEEYDPLNPAVGNVASVVKVTARKSSVPKSLQANKSLLLRAVSEAEKSVTLKKAPGTKPFTSQMVVRPLQRNEPSSESIYETMAKQPKLELTSKSKQQDIYRRMKYTIDNEPEAPKYVIRREEVYQPTYITRPTDNRVVEYIPQPIMVIKEEPESSEDDVVEISPPEESPTPIVLEESIIEEFEEEKPVVMVSRTIKDKPVFYPKFVVTLDGIDPEEYEDSDVSMTTLMLPHVNKVSPPKVRPFNINLKDSDDDEKEEDVEMTPLQHAKATERCKFWPGCVNGNACQYHHPTLPCKTFPHCKFSDKCLYIHPNCKYDAKCSRPECPYTHATRRMPSSLGMGIPQVLALPSHQVLVSAPSTFQPPPPSSPSVQKHCVYYPNCNNMSCPFYHPTPCRFGLKCKNRFCTYYHPSLPTKDKLKWSARKSTETTDSKEVPSRLS